MLIASVMATAFAAPSGPVEFEVAGDVEVREDGSLLAVGLPPTLEDPVRAIVLDVVSALRFEPYAADGRAVPMVLRVRIVPGEAGYTFEPVAARFGSGAAHPLRVGYPPESLRHAEAGDVLAAVQVSPEGAVETVAVLASRINRGGRAARRRLEGAALAALTGATFFPCPASVPDIRVVPVAFRLDAPEARSRPGAWVRHDVPWAEGTPAVARLGALDDDVLERDEQGWEPCVPRLRPGQLVVATP
ncbi:hypothetical protein [Coralloluteibacterium thermophilus]|uniref:TonB family protein n=1 Tax=Coralloluteibacterium thermophilum TaxID=2707049 RepID=A0ABV9NFA2_9GAMM